MTAHQHWVRRRRATSLPLHQTLGKVWTLWLVSQGTIGLPMTAARAHLRGVRRHPQRARG